MTLSFALFEIGGDNMGGVSMYFIGTGHEICHIPEDFNKKIEKMGLNLEIMSTPSACRTYNVLLSEGRRIAIAALAVEER